jgi:8-oxo-dGTP pyrophosphatase MutT (NUDIX family)
MADLQLTLDHVKKALALAAPEFDARAAQLKMSPQPRPLVRTADGEPRRAATLMLLYPIEEQLHFALTRRHDNLAYHAGQISLPGGSQDPGETYQETALRETCEEIGVCEGIEILGALTDVYIPPSDFLVFPFVGCLPQRPEWRLITSEVTEIIECPLEVLLDHSLKGREDTDFKGLIVNIAWYQVNGYRVWGATAVMLSEMEGRLRHVLTS